MIAALRAEVARLARVTPERVDPALPLAALGLDSLMAVELLHRIEAAFGAAVPLARLLEGPSLLDLAAEIAGAAALPSPVPPAAFTPAAGETDFPLSAGQEALWLLHYLAGGGPLFNLSGAARLLGPLDPSLLRRRAALLAERHPALRTTFRAPGGERETVSQRVHPGLAPEWSEEDASGWSEAELRARLAEMATRPFDLSAGPPLRLALFRRGSSEHVLAVAVHHLAADFWSIGVLVADLARLCAGEAPPPPAATYRDFVAWQRERLAGPRGEELWDFWRGALAGCPASLDLPADRPRPPARGFGGGARSLRLDGALAGRLQALGRAEGATPFVTLLAGFSALLGRLSGQQDLLVAAPTAGRGAAAFADVVGYFVNPVVLRVGLAGDPGFAALLRRARTRALAAFAHQELPFPLLAERLQPEREASRPPLAQVMLTYQKPHLPGQEGLAAFVLGAEGGRIGIGGVTLEALDPGVQAAELDLHLYAAAEPAETGDGGLLLRLVYDAALFDATTAERLLGHLATLLADAAADPGRPLSELALLTPAERAQLAAWNDTAQPLPEDLCLHRLCEAQADRTPDAVAVVCGDESLSFRQLDEQANRMAHHLRALGVGAEDRVGLLLERSLDLMTALLAVLKAGAAYVPLDPSYPSERLAYLAADAGIAALLAQERLAGLLPAPADGGWPTVLTDAQRADHRAEIDRRPVTRPAEPVDPDQLCYVIYTSGSTGRPKGAMNTHRAVANRLLWSQEALGLSAADRLLQKTPIGFDVSVPELFWPLLAGARLVLARPGGHRDAAYLAAEIARTGVTTVHFVPPMLRVFLEEPAAAACTSLRRVLCSGEALPPDLRQAFFAAFPGVELHNLYGPTEAAIEVTAWACAPEEGLGPVPIGRPISNLRIHLLDRAGQPVPVGVPGELLIGGVGLARGYHRRPELTAGCFVPDPWAGPVDRGARLYRTGDLARRLPGGEIEYLGRLDHQVKIRGVRIELGEVEAALAEHPRVRRAVAVAHRRGAEPARLAAYVVPAEEGTPEAALREGLRRHLRRTLPEAMVPSVVVFLAELPLSPNGKVDRRALPAPEEGGPEAGPAGGIEDADPVAGLVAAVFAEVLGVEAVRADDSFFELGGHSLLVGRVAARLGAALGVEVGVRTVFEHPTPAGLARRLAGEPAAALDPPRRVPRGGPLPLSPAQERLWLVGQLTDSPVYHELLALRWTGPLDPAVLAGALAAVVERHEVLRTAFVTTAGAPAALPGPGRPPRLPLIELAALPAPLAKAEVAAVGRALARPPFDLAAGEPLRAALVRTAGHTHALLLNLHHLVVDGWSWRVLVGELAALYGAAVAGLASPLSALPLQYADYAVWQRRRLADDPGGRFAGELAYWRERLAGLPALLELPADRPRPAVQTFRGRELHFELPAPLAARLRAAGRAQGATLFMLLAAAFGALLHRLTGRDDLALGTPIANREHPDLEGLIGLFLNNLVLRLDATGDPGFAELLARLRAAALGAYAHRELPFERLVEELQPERSLSHTPLVQVAVVHHGEHRPAGPGLPGLDLELLEIDPGTAKFDLSLSWRETTAGGLAGCFAASADLFDPATVRRWQGHLTELLAAAAERPALRLSELPLLTAGERLQLLIEWGGAAANPGTEPFVPVHELFLAAADRQPAAVAVAAPGVRWSYGELAARSGALATVLQDLGVGPETRVALCAVQPAARVLSALAVLGAGGAYVPLDPAWPADRLGALLADAGAPVLLWDGAGRPAWAGDGVQVFHLDGQEGAAARGGRRAGEPGRAGSAPAVAPVDPRSAAYAIYTSGSTGRPKAVVVPHAGLANLAAWHRRAYGVTPGDRATLLAAPAFDAAVWEVWPYLTAGASLHAPEPEVRTSAADLVGWLEEERITLAFLTTPLAEAALAEPWPAGLALRSLLTGGDRLRVRPRPGLPFELVNHYGPTESSVVATWGVADPAAGIEAVPPDIGRPIANLQARLLDRSLEPVPPGVAGELCIAGAGLARGYLGRPDLTAGCFVPDPHGAPGTRLYRTGDLARWRPDGRIDFLGRTDHQVKVRGFRIEPGEVEAALLQIPGVTAAAVGVRPGPQGDPRLVAWLAGDPAALPDNLPAAADLRATLGRSLPEALIPAAFVVLPALPLSANGKVDRAFLPAPDWAGAAGATALRTPLEELVAGLFGELLGVGQVGVDDDFFALGGHSLLATRLAARLREELAVDLPLRAMFESPTVEGLARRLAALRREEAGPDLPPLVPTPRRAPAPLSPAQQRLWFFDRLEPGSALYNIPLAVDLEGPLSVPALAASLAAVAGRHEVLRTVFATAGAQPVQAVTAAVPVLPVIDLAALPRAARAVEASRLEAEEARRPFDLAVGPPVRAALLAHTRESHTLVLNLHHIAADGWSMEVLVDEISAFYALAAGLPATPPTPLPVQYADYAVWQRSWLEDASLLAAALAAWEERLAGAPPVSTLPLDRPRPAARSFQGNRHPLLVPAATADRLAAWGRAYGATPFMILLAGFQAALARTAGQSDLVVGAPVANRGRREIERLVGFFANTLPLRVDLGGDPTFAESVARSREAVLAGAAGQHLPLERLVEHLQPVRHPGQTPLFQTVVALQDGRRPPRLPGVRLAVRDLPTGTAKFDLTIVLVQGPDGLAGWIESAAALFDGATVLRFADHLLRLLAGAAEEPGRRLSELPLLSPAERHQILHDWNDTAAGIPQRPIHELFSELARTDSGRIAAELGGTRLTYGELDARADRLARALVALGVEPEVPVAVCAGRSLELLVGLLGVLKAGGCYVPLDPSYPARRLESMLARAGAPAVLVQGDLGLGLPGVAVFDLDDPAGWPRSEAKLPTVPPDALAYVMFTSGSTGEPKGVAVPHRAVVRLVRGTSYARFGADQVFLQLAPTSFDASTFEIWGALLNGGRLVVMPPHAPTLGELARELERRRVSALWLTAGLFHQMVDHHLDSLRGVAQLLAGGDVLSAPHARRAADRAPGTVLIDGYGPTENTTFSCCHPLRPGDPLTGTVPIGRPIANSRAYLLDRDLRPVPAGTPAELYLAGDGLARGYLGAPGLTAERFVPAPLAEAPGTRLYRTGDLVRRRPDGVLEFLGRLDGQVKIRGFRIEPGEVEAALAGLPGIRQAAVVVHGEGGDKRLAAYLVAGRPGAHEQRDELRELLRERLPEHMIPAHFVFLAELPVTPNGKVDRTALPPPGQPAADRPPVAPRTPTEEVIAGIWAEVLGADRLGVEDDFFELGGHSLAATRVMAEVHARFGIELPLAQIFQQPTVAGLAAALEEALIAELERMTDEEVRRLA